MPDLSSKGSHEFWYNYPDPIIYQVVSFMESVENWTFDGDPEFEKWLTELGNALDAIGNVDLQEEDKIIQTSACIKIGRALRLLQCIDTAHPGAASKILMYAEKAAKTNSTFNLFLRRNVVFERMRLLKRIFSEDRLNIISKAIASKE